MGRMDDDTGEMQPLERDESELLALGVLNVVLYRIRYQPMIVLLGIAFGCLSGLLGGLFGVGGPPTIVYFTLLRFSGPEIRDTAIVISVLIFKW